MFYLHHLSWIISCPPPSNDFQKPNHMWLSRRRVLIAHYSSCIWHRNCSQLEHGIQPCTTQFWRSSKSNNSPCSAHPKRDTTQGSLASVSASFCKEKQLLQLPLLLFRDWERWLCSASQSKPTHDNISPTRSYSKCNNIHTQKHAT
jgi:hypothetical protein